MISPLLIRFSVHLLSVLFNEGVLKIIEQLSAPLDRPGEGGMTQRPQQVPRNIPGSQGGRIKEPVRLQPVSMRPEKPQDQQKPVKMHPGDF